MAIDPSDLVLVSGFNTDVSDDRYRIFGLHQSHLRISGCASCYVFCSSGKPLPEAHKIAGIEYLMAPPSTDGVTNIVHMARAAADIADAAGKHWLVLTHADIWGRCADWALHLIDSGLETNPEAELIAIAFGRLGYGARLIAATPRMTRLVFDERHAERYHAVRELRRPRKYLYETYLRDRVRSLDLLRKVALRPGQRVLKNEKLGSDHRTFVPTEPELFHEHAHVYQLVRDTWFLHPLR